jgi:hypothetical protein
MHFPGHATSIVPDFQFKLILPYLLLVCIAFIHIHTIHVEQTFEVWPKTVVIILEKTVQQQGHVVNRVLSVQSRLKKIKGEVHQD